MRRRDACGLLAVWLGCGDDLDEATCDLDPAAVIEARAGTLQADGTVTVYGAIHAADDGRPDRAVHAVYVADQEVQPAASEFNFRSWSVSLSADRLAAFTIVAMDGAKQARLPVRVYLQGACVLELPEDRQPVIEFAATR
jgi:hypothetical protein